MKQPKPICLDFETAKIEGRPKYPPVPVGVSIKWPGKKCHYYAWGHPTENNCSFEDGKRAVRAAYVAHQNDGAHLLHHNGKFDIDVAQVHCGVADIVLDPLRLHDTQFLLFLVDPHAFSLQLKPAAVKWLDMAAEEQAAVRDWLIEHQRELKGEGLLEMSTRITTGNFGAYISLAPGKLVGKYADGDIARTLGLFDFTWKWVVESGMLAAYQREQKLLIPLLDNERRGMKCDVAALERDLPVYEDAIEQCDRWLRKRLKAPNLDFNKDRDVADALDAAGIVEDWTYTKTGLKSINKKNLKPQHYLDQKVFQALGYRNKADNAVSTYYRPWLETAHLTGGILHAGWNQTRNDKDSGTRTGRLSSSPNFMAVAKGYEDKGDGWAHPEFIKGLTHLPLMRQYLLPDSPKHWWGRRDYNSQELRLLAHFEDGLLMEEYVRNPWLDVHKFVQNAIKELLGLDLPRTPVKTLNFGLIYGQGVGSMADKLSCTVEEVQSFRKAQFSALPGLKDLDATTKARGKRGEPITTWGGRVYYAEEPRIIEGRWRDFSYKLLNYLIQGSAADVTKEAVIRYHEAGYGDARFLVTVHDEINISAPKGAFRTEMLRLRDIMQSVEIDVPMLSDAEFGPNWGQMSDLKEPKFDLKSWLAAKELRDALQA